MTYTVVVVEIGKPNEGPNSILLVRTDTEKHVCASVKTTYIWILTYRCPYKIT